MTQGTGMTHFPLLLNVPPDSDSLLQRNTPWYDGVPSVQQCPIAPGKSLRYQFKADLFGTSWYHSHYSAQYAGGAFGGKYDSAERNL